MNEIQKTDAAREVDSLIIGSGFGGIGMAIRLEQAGRHDFLVLEKAGSLGGVWRDNTYPGAACDVPSHLYSFSFARHYDWSRRFAEQREILGYLEYCARHFGISNRLRYDHEVTRAVFDEATGRWLVSCTNGSRFSARTLITATGQLSRPAIPQLPGRERFTGRQFHSAEWDHDYPLEGKRVAVIGTGASAIQFVPRVATQATGLLLFQRSAPYVVSKPDRVWRSWQRTLMRRLPWLQDLDRLYIYLLYETRVFGFAISNALLKFYELSFRRQLRRQISDPALRARLQPDYPMGCKRILLANDYYSALARDNVEVIDKPIRELDEGAVIDADGQRHPVDALIWGTGFAATEFLAPMNIQGRDGITLDDAWAQGAEAYKGISVSGFPNLFILYGPNTNLGHSSIIHMLESQFHYVLQGLNLLDRDNLRWIDVRKDVQHDFNRRLQQRLTRTIWARDCHSWYKTEDGRNTNNWSGFTLTYRALTRTLKQDDYEFRSH